MIDLPIKSGDFPVSFLYVYQRVDVLDSENGIVLATRIGIAAAKMQEKIWTMTPNQFFWILSTDKWDDFRIWTGFDEPDFEMMSHELCIYIYVYIYVYVYIMYYFIYIIIYI